MLILAGVNVEATSQGTRYMLCFGSPRNPGVHYRVETDAGTVERLQTAINSEVKGALQSAFEIEAGDDDDSARRFG